MNILDHHSLYSSGLEPFRKQQIAAIFLGILISAGHLVQAATFQGLGDLPGENFDSAAHAISADGSLVVGYGSEAYDSSQACRWSNNGISSLGKVPGFNYSEATAVSANGSVIVGEFFDVGVPPQAFRWSNNMITFLGYLPGNVMFSRANGVSADGSVIVGGSNGQAFRWSNNVMTGLGYFPGGNSSEAFGVSADGSVIVGMSNANGGLEACRWINNVITGLGILPGYLGSRANAVSANGSVIVGYAFTNADAITEAFRWSNNVMTGLGILPGYDSTRATAISADGSIIVGYADFYDATNDTTFFEAFRWDATNGMQSLTALLTTAGVNLTGWTLTHATGISADSKTIVGYGKHNGKDEAWIFSELPILIPPFINLPSPSILPPSVSISGKKKITTTKLKYTLKGTALGIVSSVKVKVGKRTKIATGTNAWKFTAKKLKLGKNKVLVTATGPGGTSAPAKAIIIRK